MGQWNVIPEFIPTQGFFWVGEGQPYLKDSPRGHHSTLHIVSQVSAAFARLQEAVNQSVTCLERGIQMYIYY